ncbi:hypothetical protein MCI89_20980 [Muricomes sp. OA1]|uniref:hypothetical protein n=1 Tax=Faecalicatena contorta TaxID=39482 RepID=UPI001FBAD5A5|nr:hypothetical protein [Faecalicatena contorta]MCH1973646.1 hypothetical protein [Muricomes sp. OA1]MCH1974822.1 hypothetical protein [Muricomes sp. OA1]
MYLQDCLYENIKYAKAGPTAKGGLYGLAAYLLMVLKRFKEKIIGIDYRRK